MDEKRGYLFDAAMGPQDGAGECELVGTFLLEIISDICNEGDIGFYGDDGLAIYRNKSVYLIRENKKEIAKIIETIRPRNNSRKQPKNRKLSGRNFELKRWHF